MKYLIAIIFVTIFAVMIYPNAFATKFIRNGIEYNRSTESNIKSKVRTKFYQGSVAKKLKLKGDKQGWETVDY